MQQVDFSVIKGFRITERLKMTYRCEFFNGLNHPQFDGPQLGPTNTNFGNITSQSNLARSIQMALRMTW